MGWHGESRRHSLARKGIKTAHGIDPKRWEQDLGHYGGLEDSGGYSWKDLPYENAMGNVGEYIHCILGSLQRTIVFESQEGCVDKMCRYHQGRHIDEECYLLEKNIPRFAKLNMEYMKEHERYEKSVKSIIEHSQELLIRLPKLKEIVSDSDIPDDLKEIHMMCYNYMINIAQMNLDSIKNGDIQYNIFEVHQDKLLHDIREINQTVGDWIEYNE